MKKKLLSALLCATMISSMLVGCGGSEAATESTETTEAAQTTETAEAEETTEEATEEVAAGEGQVYYLNFKPEQDEQWQALAKSYTEQTGVPVTVVTAASVPLYPLHRASRIPSEVRCSV